MNLAEVQHTGRNLTVTIRGFKNWFGFRDFNLVVKNMTGVGLCFEQVAGECVSCLNGFRYDKITRTCDRCSEGYYFYTN